MAQPLQPNQAPATHHPIHQAAIPIPDSARIGSTPQQSVPSGGAAGQPKSPGSGNLQTGMSEQGNKLRTDRTVLAHGLSDRPSTQSQHVKQKTHQQLRNARSHHVTGSHKIGGAHQSRPTHGTSKRSTKHAPVRKHVKYTPAITLHTQQSPHGTSPGEAHWKEKDRGVGMEHGTQTSPLDTPAPRRHAPVPLSQDPPRMSHLG